MFGHMGLSRQVVQAGICQVTPVGPEHVDDARYYGVIIVRTLLFLVGLIWMQHLMVRRVSQLQGGETPRTRFEALRMCLGSVGKKRTAPCGGHMEKHMEGG